MNARWICQSCRRAHAAGKKATRRSVRQVRWQSDAKLDRVRNIGIIAHIDAGKTTTTERMLFYSGFTKRIGDVDEGSTVTDFLPAERARGITIQSAAITFYWPPNTKDSHTVNLIDTPGHADFTFEVIRSLRVLDGAVCILDGVAGVEAQTEQVWRQANGYQIPRIIYVNKLDRTGAAFNRTVREIGSKLNTFPLLCQIPWWRNGSFIGVADIIELKALEWQGGDGRLVNPHDLDSVKAIDPELAAEIEKARIALVEALAEVDDDLVESFLEADEDWMAIDAPTLWKSLRKSLLGAKQAVTPVFAGASFRNIGVQPLLDGINTLLPSPNETAPVDISLEEVNTSLTEYVTSSNQGVKKISALALAFKVVNDKKRGVLVYVRVYHGSLARNSLLYNTNLAVYERGLRLLRMYADDAVEIDSIEAGQIGVLAGLKHARTGDTLLVYQGPGNKPPPSPIHSLQLRPIDVPPPLFFTSVEPHSLGEERNLKETLAILLREDPSLHVTTDEESGQLQLSGMGELHLEIARDRLIGDFNVKATTGNIEISYKERPTVDSSEVTFTFDKEIAGKAASATCVASVGPLDQVEEGPHTRVVKLRDGNVLVVNHPSLTRAGRSLDGLPLLPSLTLTTIINAMVTGASAALARGPRFRLPMGSTCVTVRFDHSQHLTATSSLAAISSAARLAVAAAIKEADGTSANGMMEPVMLATISVPGDDLGSVIQDLSSARGAQVLALDEGAEVREDVARLTPAQLANIYAPPDPFGSSEAGSSGPQASQRRVKARVPLREMIGYLKHLRSLTGGRGTFIMSVDRYESMTANRMREVQRELYGEYA